MRLSPRHARFFCRRPAGQGRVRGERAHDGDCVAVQADHDQFVPCGFAERRLSFRFADCLGAFVSAGHHPRRSHRAPVAGALPAAMAASEDDRTLVCPSGCGAEAAWVGAINVIAPTSLAAAVAHFSGRNVLPPAMLVGAPGSGKSMLAARIPGILPPLTPTEALETSMIHSLSGLLNAGGIQRERPFREPHHTASMAAIVGGGRTAKPGEISLAHNGVLFMDEFPEFTRTVLETLRQPIETGEVVVARANAHVKYPCRFMLVAAANPCKCGYLADPGRACSRAPVCGEDYMGPAARRRKFSRDRSARGRGPCNPRGALLQRRRHVEQRRCRGQSPWGRRKVRAFGARLSPCPAGSAHDCGFGWRNGCRRKPRGRSGKFPSCYGTRGLACATGFNRLPDFRGNVDAVETL